MAYLATMGARLIEMHRKLKPTGSILLHCDPTASHYLKMLMDSVFGEDAFLNEVIWKRSSAHNAARRWPRSRHHTFLFGRRPAHLEQNLSGIRPRLYRRLLYPLRFRWPPFAKVRLTGAGVRRGATGKPWRGIDVTEKGRHWSVPPEELERMDMEGKIHWPAKEDGMPMFKRYLDEQPGVPAQDIITDIPPMHNLTKERIGYPTQKPIELLERLITAASNEGDTILDPYCGCRTTIEAAERLNRKWIGIDVSYYAIRLVQRRLQANIRANFKVEVSGIPADFRSAKPWRRRIPMGFQQWAVDELGCQLWNDGKRAPIPELTARRGFMAVLIASASYSSM